MSGDLRKNNKAVFLDRDGVINPRKYPSIGTWNKFEFLPGVKDAIRKLNNKGYLVIVVSNQGAVGWGVNRKAKVEEIHRNMKKELVDSGAELTDVFMCTHNPMRRCRCRKPRIGMLEDAAKKYGIVPEGSWMIGDKRSDVKAGNTFGCKTVLIDPSIKKAVTNPKGPSSAAEPDLIAADLLQAVWTILKMA